MNFKLKFFNLDWPSFMADQPDKYMPLHIKRWWDRGLQPARLPSTWCWLFVYAHLQRTLETLKKLYPKSMRHPPSLSATVIKEMEEISNTWQALLRFEGKHEAWENFHDMHNVRELKQHRFNGFLVKESWSPHSCLLWPYHFMNILSGRLKLTSQYSFRHDGE